MARLFARHPEALANTLRVLDACSGFSLDQLRYEYPDEVLEPGRTPQQTLEARVAAAAAERWPGRRARRHPRPPRARARADRAARLRALLPDRPRDRRLRPRARHPLPGPRLGRQLRRLLRARRHRGRSRQARPAVRALRLRQPRRAARHRHRLRARAARGGDPARLRPLRPRPRRHLRHRDPLPHPERRPRGRQGDGAVRGRDRAARQGVLGAGRRAARWPRSPRTRGWTSADLRLAHGAGTGGGDPGLPPPPRHPRRRLRDHPRAADRARRWSPTPPWPGRTVLGVGQGRPRRARHPQGGPARARHAVLPAPGLRPAAPPRRARPRPRPPAARLPGDLRHAAPGRQPGRLPGREPGADGHAAAAAARPASTTSWCRWRSSGPGPIQGDMVHPYLRRRAGLEEPSPTRRRRPSTATPTSWRGCWARPSGVPLFQEQAMRIAVVAAEFTPDEADDLRRAMATFKYTQGVAVLPGAAGRGHGPARLRARASPSGCSRRSRASAATASRRATPRASPTSSTPRPG